MSHRHWTVRTSIRLSLALAWWSAAHAQGYAPESREQFDARMAWWREARFGMFIHWGLYAVPAGAWKERTNYGEWIRHSAQIPLEEYEKFLGRFNPVKFDADEWVRMAKDAGMKYIVITSKHHDGFCLWDSKETDWDVGSTPFQRDILRELSEACRKGGVRFATYHSIMDWHHPDYLPRRDWEKDARPADGADFDRYVRYMKNQLAEIVKGYQPAILWFDGEWESTWTHERGVDLYHYVRGLKPDIIINNRVDVLRDGMAGFSKDTRAVGDYDTPEQEIPAAAVTAKDWETCMTMNDNWGYNAQDRNFKSSEDLVRKLIDIASKNGNFLLNVGPTAEGTFPPESIARLRDIGGWMKGHGESIYGTKAGPFRSLAWGRCTQRTLDGGDTRLFLHVFDWPRDGKLVVRGLLNEAKGASLLSGGDRRPLDVKRDGDALVVAVPPRPIDRFATVVVVDVAGKPDVGLPPVISAECPIFVETLDVALASEQENVDVRYSLDGSEPTATSPLATAPVRLSETATVKARSFRGGRPVSDVSEATFTKVAPEPATRMPATTPGVQYEYFEGEWDRLPDFDNIAPIKRGDLTNFDLSPRNQDERFAFRYRAYLSVPRTGVYRFYTTSDDGSQLVLNDTLVVDNDGLHGMSEKSGVVALSAGPHVITVTMFERTGGDGLIVEWSGPGIDRQRIPASVLFRPNR